MTQKWLGALVLVQTVSILYLAWLVRASDGAEDAPHSPAAVEARVSAAPLAGPSAAAGLSEERLRQIIADEIGKHLSVSDAVSEPDGAPVAPDPDQMVHAERVSEQIEYHISVGSISHADMQALQGRIARLNPADRKRMLGKLARAMSQGLIDGQL